MKIRSSFVTNSSSSSFIVTFDKVPESTYEMQKLLFGDRQEYPSPYSDDYWPTLDVANIVLNDMEKPATKEEIMEELEQRFYWSTYRKFEGEEPKYPHDWDNTEERETYLKLRQEVHQKVDDECKRLAKEIYDRDFAGKEEDTFIFSYADENGNLGCAMEHGTLFDKVDHIRISHH